MVHARLNLIVLSIMVFAFIFFQFYAVKNKFRVENRHILALLKDLEIKWVQMIDNSLAFLLRIFFKFSSNYTIFIYICTGFRMNIANKRLEQRVLDKSIDTQDERLEQSEQILKHRVAAVVEESLLLKIKRLHAKPISNSRVKPLSAQDHDLETLARVKEFVYNYNMLTDIPKGK